MPDEFNPPLVTIYELPHYAPLVEECEVLTVPLEHDTIIINDETFTVKYVEPSSSNRYNVYVVRV